MNLDSDLYMGGVVEQARNGIESAGYEQSTTLGEADKVFRRDGTTLVIINSVYGRVGGTVRPAVGHALHYDRSPNRLVTVLAGQDKEATQQAGEYFEGYAPSSSSFALMKDGKITEMIGRHQIEDCDVVDVIN